MHVIDRTVLDTDSVLVYVYYTYYAKDNIPLVYVCVCGIHSIVTGLLECACEQYKAASPHSYVWLTVHSKFPFIHRVGVQVLAGEKACGHSFGSGSLGTCVAYSFGTVIFPFSAMPPHTHTQFTNDTQTTCSVHLDYCLPSFLPSFLPFPYPHSNCNAVQMQLPPKKNYDSFTTF